MNGGDRDDYAYSRSIMIIIIIIFYIMYVIRPVFKVSKSRVNV